MRFSVKNMAVVVVSVALVFFSLSYMLARLIHPTWTGLTEADADYQIASRIQEKQEEREAELKKDLIGLCKDGEMKVAGAGYVAFCQNSKWIVPGATRAQVQVSQ